MWQKLLAQALNAIVIMVAKGAVKAAPEFCSKVKSWWNGKCIAIIGPTASGKNSLFNKLKREKAPIEHIQTRGAEEIGTFNFAWPLPDKSIIDFKCKNSINVGGEIDERERYWLQSCQDADVIFYLIDLEKLIKGNSIVTDRIKSDIKWLASNIPQFKAGSSIHLLVNKIDILSNNCDPVEIESIISNGTKIHLDEIENIAKKVLGPHFERISGISPISMTDPHLFSVYFTAALQSVFNARNK